LTLVASPQFQSEGFSELDKKKKEKVCFVRGIDWPDNGQTDWGPGREKKRKQVGVPDKYVYTQGIRHELENSAKHVQPASRP
jgi:hypothetical protein